MSIKLTMGCLPQKLDSLRRFKIGSYGILIFFIQAMGISGAYAEEKSAAIYNPIPKLDVNAMIDDAVPEYVILKPIEQVTFSSELVASIERINVKEGSSFNKGDALLEMDCRIQRAELDKAKAQKNSTDMALASATKLKNYGAISDFEYTQALTQKQVNNADVDKLSAIVDKCIIKAPFKGSVADLFVHSHETVKPGDPLLKIVNADNLIFELQVPSNWLKWLRVGTDFEVDINETSQKLAAKITKINPAIDSVSQTVKIVGTIIHPSADLRPGMSGQAIFPSNPNNKSGKRK